MNIFKSIFSKKEEQEVIKDKNSFLDGLEEEMSVKKSLLSTEEETTSDKKLGKEKAKKSKYTIEESCDSLIDAMRQLEDLKIEYHAVTSYLTDIQKIDGILEEDKDELVEVARKIVTATREKATIQTSGKRVSETMYKVFSTYDDDVVEEAKRMKDNEIFLSKIEKDMKHLEGEKASLFLQEESNRERKTYLKKIGVLTTVFTILLFTMFTFIGIFLEANIWIPSLLTILMVVVVGAYVIIHTKEISRDNKQIEVNLNRAITLLNKVKIKYINTTNAIEYTCQKYKVKNYTELSYLYDQYRKTKEDEKKYSQHSEVLEYEKKSLLSILRMYQLEDPSVWVYQAVALIDNKEMVEVRHGLNTRRQKLRESMDYNTKLQEDSISRIKEYLDKLPEEKAKYEPLLRKFGIYI